MIFEAVSCRSVRSYNIVAAMAIAKR